jgi:hypothetical protein
MREQEAHWIRDTLALHAGSTSLAGAGAPAPVALNLGSGTRKAREQSKPHIDACTLAPLRAAGYRVVHSDLFAGDGVDLAGDMFDPAFQQRLRALEPSFMYFCNTFEHLENRLREQAPAVLDGILAPGGLLLVTAPQSYPYHADPIDNMYRVTPEQIAALFPGYAVLRQAAVECGSYGEEFRAGSFGRRARKVLRLLAPFVRPRRWLTHAHRFLWMNRPYVIACVLLRKPSAPPA